MLIIFVCALCLFYPFVHNFLRWIGEFLFQGLPTVLVNYIRLINIIYLPIHLVVFYLYFFGDFSIFFGWDSIQNSPDGGAEFSEKRRGGLLLIAFVLLPFFLCFASILYTVFCLHRVIFPQKVLDGDYD